MPLEELPESERSCDNCSSHIRDVSQPLCVWCTRYDVHPYVGEIEDQWYESRTSRLERAEKLIAGVERERDAALAEVARLREWLAQRTAVVGTTFACEAIVSDTCIANRGPDGAASEACYRLSLAFGSLLSKAKYQVDRRYHFVLVVENGGA